jgi:hypothetical protein
MKSVGWRTKYGTSGGRILVDKYVLKIVHEPSENIDNTEWTTQILTIHVVKIWLLKFWGFHGNDC